jgi:hypothetical protein
MGRIRPKDDHGSSSQVKGGPGGEEPQRPLAAPQAPPAGTGGTRRVTAVRELTTQAYVNDDAPRAARREARASAPAYGTQSRFAVIVAAPDLLPAVSTATTEKVFAPLIVP